MARKPTIKNLKEGVDGTQMINSVLNSHSIFDDVPRVSPGNINTLHTVGTILASGDNDLYNKFVTQLFNRIIMEIIQTIYFTNPWRRVKRGLLEAGDKVEEIAFHLCTPHQYDSTDDNAYPKQEPPQVVSRIHQINYQKYYKTTVKRPVLLQAFVSWDGMERFVNEQISTLYTSAELDEYVTMKYMIGRATLLGYIYAKNIPGTMTEQGLKALSIGIRATANNMELLKTMYNYSHVPTNTKKSRQLVILNSDVEAALNVEVLADAFNMSKADFNNNRILIDSFSYSDNIRLNDLFKDEIGYEPFTAQEITLLNSIQAWVVDERFFMIFDVLFELSRFWNPEKLYHNFWLHTWKIVSYSTLVNAITFTPETGEPQSITITAEPAATVNIGDTVNLTAAIDFGQNKLPEILPQIMWEITTANTTSKLNVISDIQAMLTIGAGEPNAALTITASLHDSTGTLISGSITITVNQGN